MNELGLEDKVYAELLNDWDMGHKNKDIIAKYNLSIPANNLRAYIQPLILSELCPYCKTPMQLIKRNRISSGWENPPTCPSCNHIEKVFCNCAGCIMKRKEEVERENKERRKALLSLNKTDTEPISFSQLTLEQQLWVASFIYGLSDESLDILTTIREAYVPIHPNSEKASEMLKELIKLGAFHIIDFDDHHYDGSLEDVNFQNLLTKLNTTPQICDLYQSIHDDSIEFNSSPDDLRILEKELLISEIYEIIEYNMDKVGFAYRPGEKTRLLVERMISKFDYLQITGMIWSTTNHTLRYVQESRVSKTQAFNTFIHNLEKYFQLNLQENWTPRRSFRPKECPITAYRYLFDRLKQRSNNMQSSLAETN